MAIVTKGIVNAGAGAGGGYVVIDQQVAAGGETILEVDMGDIPLEMRNNYNDIIIIASVGKSTLGTEGIEFSAATAFQGTYQNNNLRSSYAYRSHGTTAPTYASVGFGGNSSSLNFEATSHIDLQLKLNVKLLVDTTNTSYRLDGELNKGNNSFGRISCRTGIQDARAFRLQVVGETFLAGSILTILGLPK